MSTGCTLKKPASVQISTQEQACLDFFDQLDYAIDRHTFFEASVQRIHGYPIYRSDRFLSSFDPQNISAAEKITWKAHLQKTATEAYKLEASRLPDNTRSQLTALINSQTVGSGITRCSNTLYQYFIEKEKHTPFVEETLNIRDNYSKTARFLGFYFLSKIAAQPFINAYQQEMTTRFHQGPNPHSPVIIYQPKKRALLNRQKIQQIITNSYKSSPLKIPDLNRQQLADFFSYFSPNLSLESNNPSDHIGSPKWKNASHVRIDISEPRLYTFPSYTRLHGHILLQLNYAFWFPERPPKNPLDLYAGSLDGIIWRVTLNSQGQPLLFDSIHQCGCYHKAYLLKGVSHRSATSTVEPPLFFEINVNPYLPVTININSSSHYIVGISQPRPTRKPSTPQQLFSYDTVDYSTLSRIPHGNVNMSLFGPDGIIQQSWRHERWLLWPLGIINTGAMRQKGTHAITFTDRRHFDDPFLWETFGIQQNSPD